MSDGGKLNLTQILVSALIGAVLGIGILALYQREARRQREAQEMLGDQESEQAMHWPTTANSPVTVHGGAMAFRAAHGTGKWIPEATDGKGNVTGYCLAYAPKSITLGGVSATDIAITVTNIGWTLVFYGGDPTQSSLTPGSNGIQMVANQTQCNGKSGTGGYSIHLTLVNNSAFYPNVRAENDKSTAVRFEDTTPGVGGAPSVCSGPDGNAKGDEDACERLAGIKVTTGAATDGLYTCQNQRCEVDVGP